MKIRMATTKDTAAILDIYAFYIENTAISFELIVPSISEYAARIKKYSAEAPWLVAEEKGRIMGFAYASPHRGRAAYIWNREVSVYINEDFQRRGIARKLYTILLKILKLQGYANALAGIVPPNPKSIAFHQKMGFQLIGTYHKIGFKFDKWWDVEWHELFLQQEDFMPVEIISLGELAKTSKLFKSLKV